MIELSCKKLKYKTWIKPFLIQAIMCQDCETFEKFMPIGNDSWEHFGVNIARNECMDCGNKPHFYKYTTSLGGWIMVVCVCKICKLKFD